MICYLNIRCYCAMLPEYKQASVVSQSPSDKSLSLVVGENDRQTSGVINTAGTLHTLG